MGGLGANIKMPALPMRSAFGSKQEAQAGRGEAYKKGDNSETGASMKLMQQGRFVLRDQWELVDKKVIDPRDMLSFEALLKGKLSPDDYFIVANLIVLWVLFCF